MELQSNQYGFKKSLCGALFNTMVNATCHPDKQHYGLGLCKNCYEVKWYYDHRDQSLERVNKYRKANRQALQQKEKEYYHADPIRSLLINGRQRAKRKGVPFDLTAEDISLPTHCPLLGIPIYIGEGRFHAGSPTLDRLVPDKGYIKGNVWVISFRANTIKTDASWEEILAVAQGVRKKLGE